MQPMLFKLCKMTHRLKTTLYLTVVHTFFKLHSMFIFLHTNGSLSIFRQLTNDYLWFTKHNIKKRKKKIIVIEN